MKKVILIVLALVGSMAVNVQAQMALGTTMGLQFPKGDFGGGANMGFGITVIGKYMIKDNLALGASVGYSQFRADIEGVDFSIRPITGLVEYHFGAGNIHLYVGTDVGIYTTKTDFKGQEEDASFSESNFGFAPGGGLIFRKSKILSFMTNVKYNIVLSEETSTDWLGINFGAIFQL